MALSHLIVTRTLWGWQSRNTPIQQLRRDPQRDLRGQAHLATVTRSVCGKAGTWVPRLLSQSPGLHVHMMDVTIAFIHAQLSEYLGMLLLLLLSRFSRVRLCATPYTAAHQAPPVPGILQARILEWAAISFSNAWKWKVKVKSLSRARLLATPWTGAYQAPPSRGFSRQENWSGVPLPSPTLEWWGRKTFAIWWQTAYLTCKLSNDFIVAWTTPWEKLKHNQPIGSMSLQQSDKQWFQEPSRVFQHPVLVHTPIGGWRRGSHTRTTEQGQGSQVCRDPSPSKDEERTQWANR